MGVTRKGRDYRAQWGCMETRTPNLNLMFFHVAIILKLFFWATQSATPQSLSDFKIPSKTEQCRNKGNSAQGKGGKEHPL